MRPGSGVYRRGMAKAPAVQVGENLWRLRLLGDYVNAYVVRSPDGQVTLVDTGVKSSAKRVSQGLAHIGVAPQQVTRILISHVHSDHVGSVAEMARRTGAPVEVHTDDAAALESGRTPQIDQTYLLGRLLTRLGANPTSFEAGAGRAQPGRRRGGRRRARGAPHAGPLTGSRVAASTGRAGR